MTRKPELLSKRSPSRRWPLGAADVFRKQVAIAKEMKLADAALLLHAFEEYVANVEQVLARYRHPNMASAARFDFEKRYHRAMSKVLDAIALIEPELQQAMTIATESIGVRRSAQPQRKAAAR